MVNTSRVRDGSNQDEQELIDEHEKLVNRSVILKEKLNDSKRDEKEITPEQRQVWLNLFRTKHRKNESEISRIQNENP